MKNTTSEEKVNVIDFPGNNSPSHDDYVTAIHDFCNSMVGTVSPQEFGKMPMLSRLDLQRKTIAIHLARYYRIHRTADVATGVFTIITLLTDNNTGVATISEAALGELFCRSENAIHEARKRLRADGMIQSTRGRYAGSHPVIPRAIAQSYNHLAWSIEAMRSFNPQATQGDCQSPSHTGGLAQSPSHTGGLARVNPPVATNSIPLPHGGLFLKEGRKEERKEERDIFTKNVNDTPEMGFGVTAAIATIVAALGVATLPAAAEPAHVAGTSQSEMAFTAPNGGDAHPSKKGARKATGEYTRDFDEFWKVYPRREGKGAAFKSWQRLTMEQKRKAYRALKDQLATLTERATDSRGNFCPHPATWINQGRFDDDAPSVVDEFRSVYRED